MCVVTQNIAQMRDGFQLIHVAPFGVGFYQTYCANEYEGGGVFETMSCMARCITGCGGALLEVQHGVCVTAIRMTLRSSNRDAPLASATVVSIVQAHEALCVLRWEGSRLRCSRSASSPCMQDCFPTM